MLCTPFFGQFQPLNIRENYWSAGDELRFKLNSKFPVSQSTTFVGWFFLLRMLWNDHNVYIVCVHSYRHKWKKKHLRFEWASSCFGWVFSYTGLCSTTTCSIHSVLPMLWHTITIFRIQVLLLIKRWKFMVSNFEMTLLNAAISKQREYKCPLDSHSIQHVHMTKHPHKGRVCVRVCWFACVRICVR